MIDQVSLLQTLRRRALQALICECLFFLVIPFFMAIFFEGLFFMNAFLIADAGLRARYTILGGLSLIFGLCSVVLPIISCALEYYLLGSDIDKVRADPGKYTDPTALADAVIDNGL